MHTHAMTTRDPFRELSTLQREVDRVFRDAFGTGSAPSTAGAWAPFHRAVRLPDRVDGTSVTASHREGLLTIHVPKAEEAKPRRIDITTG